MQTNLPSLDQIEVRRKRCLLVDHISLPYSTSLTRSEKLSINRSSNTAFDEDAFFKIRDRSYRYFSSQKPRTSKRSLIKSAVTCEISTSRVDVKVKNESFRVNTSPNPIGSPLSPCGTALIQRKLQYRRRYSLILRDHKPYSRAALNRSDWMSYSDIVAYGRIASISSSLDSKKLFSNKSRVVAYYPHL